MKGIRGKNSLVTGGGSGIGQAIAVRLGHEGANVAINHRRGPEAAAETAEMINRCCDRIRACGGRSLPVQADVAVEDDIVGMVESVVDEFGSLDILINNAGIQTASESHETDAVAFDRVLAVNLRGSYLCAREAIKHFLSRGEEGCIVNVSSVHELIPKPRFLSYSVSKGGMGNLTRTLALEYAGRGIRVNAVGPGATVTSINRAWVDDPVKRKEVESHIPMGRAAEAEEVAAAVAFLVSDEAAYITGQTLYVDGGLTLYPDFRSAWSSE